MNLFRLQKAVVAASIMFLCAGTWGVSLAPLETLTWSMKHSGERDVEEPMAISLRAFGKPVNQDYQDIPVTEAAFYTDPLSACVALIQARFTANESWWGNLSATASDRESDGAPKASYIPDSDNNWFRFATAHAVNPDFPQPLSARIVNYLRIGGLHGFDVHWTQSGGGAYSVIIPIQEFAPGKYRYAPEWMDIMDPITAALDDTGEEDGAMASIRTAVPEFAREVHIYELFGGNPSEYPLVILFRAMPFAQCPRAGDIAALRDAVSQTAAELPEDDVAYQASSARQTMAQYLSAQSLELLDDQSAAWRSTIAVVDEIALVVDAGSFLFLGRLDGDPPMVPRGLQELYSDNGQLKISNFSTSTGFAAFVKDPRIWAVLQSKLTEIATE